jgi:hypothetical protein
MADFMLLMHGDTTAPEDNAAWDAYFGALHRSGAFEGGSSFGDVRRYRRTGEPAAAARLIGFLRVRAADWTGAEALLEGNPVLAAGGTVEVRELVRD